MEAIETAKIWFPTILALIALACALVAAKFWHQSSRVYIPDYHKVAVKFYDEGLYEAFRKSSKFNRNAAIWTAIAAVFGAASALASSLL